MTRRLPTRLPTRLARCRRGAAAVEAAFALPLLVLMLTGLVEGGRLAWTRTSLEFAVQEAARQGALDLSRCTSGGADPCGALANARNVAAAKASAAGVPASAFTVASDPACGVRVRAAHRFRFVAAGFVGAAPTLAAEVCRT